MKFRKFFFILLVSLPAFLLLSCAKKDRGAPSHHERLRIVTSFYPIYSLVKEVSGDLNDVRMIQSGAGIHEFEPSASDVAAIYDADLFVYHSRTLESWANSLNPSLEQSRVEVLEATEGMQLDKIEGLEDLPADGQMDEKSLYDPHTWLDPEKAAEEAELIAARLSKIDSKHAATYQKNADDFKKRAHVLTEKYQASLKEAKRKTFVTQHTAFSYLAKRFGLEQLGIAGLSPDQEPHSRQLAEIEDFIKKYQVETIFAESNVSSKVAETLKRATGVQVKVLNPLEAAPENDKSYLENLEENLKVLTKELNR